MQASDYQELARRTLVDRPNFTISDQDMMILWNAIGLGGEAGEVLELCKKGILHQHGLSRDELRKELGDVLWYVAALCTTAGIDMGEVMTENIEKLRTRYPEGFSSDDSQRRVDVGPIEPNAEG